VPLSPGEDFDLLLSAFWRPTLPRSSVYSSSIWNRSSRIYCLLNSVNCFSRVTFCRLRSSLTSSLLLFDHRLELHLPDEFVLLSRLLAIVCTEMDSSLPNSFTQQVGTNWVGFVAASKTVKSRPSDAATNTFLCRCIAT
jgi:hypothetical protein